MIIFATALVQSNTSSNFGTSCTTARPFILVRSFWYVESSEHHTVKVYKHDLIADKQYSTSAQPPSLPLSFSSMPKRPCAPHKLSQAVSSIFLTSHPNWLGQSHLFFLFFVCALNWFDSILPFCALPTPLCLTSTNSKMRFCALPKILLSPIPWVSPHFWLVKNF